MMFAQHHIQQSVTLRSEGRNMSGKIDQAKEIADDVKKATGKVVDEVKAAIKR